MNRKMLTLLAVPLLALAVAASAVAFVPGILNAFSAGSSTATSVAAPAWKVGDAWTYNVSLGSMDASAVLPSEMLVEPMPRSTLVLGTLKETVVGSVSTNDGPAWNVTTVVALHLGEPQPVVGTQPVITATSMPAATVSSFTWYRQSDLAPVYALKAVSLSRTWATNTSLYTMWGALANATYSLNYTSTTQIWYHPPLAVYHFPLQENASWNVSSNVTIRHDSAFAFEGPNVTFSSSHSMNFSVPLDLAVRTGTFENVTTPGGTFRALSVSVGHRESWNIPDRDTSAMMNLTSSTDVDMPPALASAWFSSSVGNVVRAEIGLGGFYGPRVELDLVSYSYS